MMGIKDRSFGSTLGWTVLGSVLPGLGLIKAGRKASGAVILIFFIGTGITLGAIVIFNRGLLYSYAANSANLLTLTWVICAVALIWVLTIVGSHLALRPKHQSAGKRTWGAAVVGVLCLAVVAPMALAADLAYTSYSLVGTVFSNNKSDNIPPIPIDQPDPWAEKPRLNVMILGGDSGEGRDPKLGIRPDTVIVASINTKTGGSTLFSLPRNLAKMPFPKDSPLHKYYPGGFANGNPADQEFMLNAMYQNIPSRVPKDILGKTNNLGADIMKVSVGEALKLDIDYYVIVNLDGFKKIINALGGVTVNVNYRVPIGGKTDLNVKPRGYIQPGPDQHLSGYKALWYARGRYGGLKDYTRMERQRCVINAVVKQADPMNVLKSFNELADAGKESVMTDIPQEMLPALLELATRVQGASLRSVVFETGEQGFSSANPDWKKIRSRVKNALQETDTATATKQEPNPLQALTQAPAVPNQRVTT